MYCTYTGWIYIAYLSVVDSGSTGLACWVAGTSAMLSWDTSPGPIMTCAKAGACRRLNEPTASQTFREFPRAKPAASLGCLMKPQYPYSLLMIFSKPSAKYGSNSQLVWWRPLGRTLCEAFVFSGVSEGRISMLRLLHFRPGWLQYMLLVTVASEHAFEGRWGRQRNGSKEPFEAALRLRVRHNRLILSSYY